MVNPAQEPNTRHMAIAQLYAPFKAPTKKDGLSFFERLSESGLPEFAYRYSTNLVEGQPFPSLALSIQEGRYKFDIKVDHYNGTLRLLCQVFFAQSWTVAERQLEVIVELFEESIAADLTIQLAEARMSFDVPTKRGTAKTNLGKRFFGIETLKQLGTEVELGMVTLKTVPEQREPDTPLDNPAREIRIERLHEDAKRFYIEIMSQWPRLTQTLKGSTMHLGPGPLSVGKETPTVYMQDIRAYVEKSVVPFVNAAKS